MALFETKSEKKALIITLIINSALVIALFVFGLTYWDPPEESGIAINFGTSEVGSGSNETPEPIQSAPVQETQPEQTVEREDSGSDNEIEEVETQEVEEAPVIEKKEEKKEEANQKTEKPTEKPKPEVAKEPEKKPDPQPEKATSDALKSILSGKNQDGKATEGEGNDQQAGNKGDPSGDPNAHSYYGQGKGLDGDGNYRLGGRQALVKKKYVQECNESGTVVVEIKVNQQGKVVRATPGVKGTTNTSSCLLNPARRAALDTEFNSDAKAPSIQTGFIIYEFKLSD